MPLTTLESNTDGSVLESKDHPFHFGSPLFYLELQSHTSPLLSENTVHRSADLSSSATLVWLDCISSHWAWFPECNEIWIISVFSTERERESNAYGGRAAEQSFLNIVSCSGWLGFSTQTSLQDSQNKTKPFARRLRRYCLFYMGCNVHVWAYLFFKS